MVLVPYTFLATDGHPTQCVCADGQTDRLREEWGLELQVFGVTNSQWMLLSATPISLSSWQTALESQVSPDIVSAVLKAIHFFLSLTRQKPDKTR